MNLSWVTCVSGKKTIWCPFLTFDIDHKSLNDVEGVYIIWHGGDEPIMKRIVRVGKGNIRDRLKTHRTNKEITAYSTEDLYVTWANVDGRSVDGVERYLGDTLNPKTPKKDKRFPDATPISVNLPW